MLAARASVVARGPGGERTIPIDDLLQGPFTTSLSHDEVITEAHVPDPGPRSSGTYLKLERKVGDYATAAVAVPINIRASAAEDSLRGAERARRPSCSRRWTRCAG
jgi:carbon-monoxide dehydrogenase medium subunit